MEERNYALDFLKICATIIIVFHHYQQVTEVVYINHINFFGGLFYWGNVVELFFVISGYVSFGYIEKIQNGYTFKHFFLKKACRLLPLVAVSAVVYEVALGLYFKLYRQDWFGVRINFFGVITDALGIQNGWVFHDPGVNYPTWYISVLMLCYVIFYIATYIGKKKGIPVIYFYLFVILMGCGINTYSINLPFLTSQTARDYYAFFTGVVLAYILNRYGVRKKAVIISVINIVTIVYVIAFQGQWIPQGCIYLLTFILYPSIIIVLQAQLFHRLFSYKVWEIWGKVSYDVYIWHNPMFLMMYILFWITRWDPDLTKISSMYIYCIASQIAGVLSYIFIEKPLNHWLRGMKENI